MLKHLFVGVVGLSSLALADGRGSHQDWPARPPPPVITVPAPAPAPVPAVVQPAPLPAVIGAHSIPDGMLPPPPPPMMGDRGSFGRGDRGGDRRDVFEARMLLNEFEHAAARFDVRALRHLERRFEVFIGQELSECDQGRFDRRNAAELRFVQRRLSRLNGRLDGFAVSQKRQLYQQVVELAVRDARDNRFDRFERFDRDGEGRRESHGRR